MIARHLNGEVNKLTDGMYDYASVALLNDGQLLTKRHSISEADELYTVSLNDNYSVNRITKENDHIFSQLKTGKVEPRWTKTVDGVLELQMELSDYGGKRLYHHRSKPPRTSRFRYGMA